MGLLELKILLVVILCVPITLLGIKFVGSLMDAALSGKKKGSARRKRARKGDSGDSGDGGDNGSSGSGGGSGSGGSGGGQAR